MSKKRPIDFSEIRVGDRVQRVTKYKYWSENPGNPDPIGTETTTWYLLKRPLPAIGSILSDEDLEALPDASIILVSGPLYFNDDASEDPSNNFWAVPYQKQLGSHKWLTVNEHMNNLKNIATPNIKTLVWISVGDRL